MLTFTQQYSNLLIIDSLAVGLLQNTALLLCLSLLYESIWLKRELQEKVQFKILAGIVIGGIAVVLMFTPWTWTEGIVFDTRSVLLSISGLFFGTVPTTVAMVIAAVMRAFSGGDGMWMGIAVIFSSGTIGILWQKFRSSWQQKNPYLELFVLGFIVHLVMLACTSFLPSGTTIPTIKIIAIPLLTIYTPATMLLGLLLLHQRKNYLNRLAAIKLVESEKKFRNLFEDHSAVKLIIDPETANIIDGNSAATDFYGYTREELQTMNISDINTLPIDKLKTEIDKVLENSKVNFEFVHRCKDGTLKNVEVFSSKIDVAGRTLLHSIIHDITDKAEAHKYITLLSKAIEHLPVSVVITDAKGYIEFVNPKFSEVTGYLADEVIGNKAGIFRSGKYDTAFYKELWNTINSGNSWQGEMQNRKKDNTLFWENVFIAPIFNNDNSITNFVSVKEDITEKRSMVSELVAAKEKAVENDKLKTSFLMNMSHEIRTPLNGILGFANIIIEEPHDTQATREYGSIIKQSGMQLLNLINDLIDISKIEAGVEKVKISKVQPASVLHEVAQQLQKMANEKNIRIVTVIPENLADHTIRTDPYKLHQILLNLANNAIKFSTKGTIECGISLNDKNLVIYIKDEGIGIPDDMKDQIFNRFFQVKSEPYANNDGVGLGLAICKGLIELLNGNIWLESEPNKGSTFFISLPEKI